MGLFDKAINNLFPISVPLARPAVPSGVTRICVSGFGISHHTGRARQIAATIAAAHPESYETWFYFDSRGYRTFLDSILGQLTEGERAKVAGHRQSPF